MRVVSLLPSATEIVCHLGLTDSLVGVTHECVYPPEVRRLPKVTRTLIPAEASSHQIDALVRERLKTQRALYTLDMPTLERLRPELIVTQALCDVCAVAEDEVREAACSLPGHPVVINLEPSRLSDVFECVRAVAEAAGLAERGETAVAELKRRVAEVDRRTAAVTDRPRVVVLEWIDPPFCAGHWSPELVRLAGGQEAIGQEGARSRTVSWQDVRDADPHVLFIACCGFDVERTTEDLPLLQSLPGYRAMRCVREGRVYVTDGSAYFSRPGPRLVDSLEILAHALHPGVHRLPPHLPAAVEVSCQPSGTADVFESQGGHATSSGAAQR